MTQFIWHINFGMMILFVFVVLVFLGTPNIATGAGRLDFLADDNLFSGRDDLVKWAGYGEDKLSTVVIDGKLLCHCGGGGDCARGRNLIHDHYPVSGATVAVLCGSTKKSWAKTSTDIAGNFMIDLPSHLHATPNLEKICRVKVVRLPKTSRRPCCCSRKHKLIKLQASIGRQGIRSYTTNKIHLMP